MDIPRLIGAIAVLAWPILAAVLVWRLFPIVHEIAKSRNFSITVGGMQLTVQEATDQSRHRLEDLQKKVEELRAKSNQKKPVAVPLNKDERPLPRRIAWVDDNPVNNAYEIARLRNDGVEVVKLISTEDAVRTLIEEQVPVRAVISDMVRREGSMYNDKAGIELVRQLRAASLEVPIFVYSSTKALTRSCKEVLAEGATDATASSVELYEMLREPLRPAV